MGLCRAYTHHQRTSAKSWLAWKSECSQQDSDAKHAANSERKPRDGCVFVWICSHHGVHSHLICGRRQLTLSGASCEFSLRLCSVNRRPTIKIVPVWICLYTMREVAFAFPFENLPGILTLWVLTVWVLTLLVKMTFWDFTFWVLTLWVLTLWVLTFSSWVSSLVALTSASASLVSTPFSPQVKPLGTGLNLDPMTSVSRSNSPWGPVQQHFNLEIMSGALGLQVLVSTSPGFYTVILFLKLSAWASSKNAEDLN